MNKLYWNDSINIKKNNKPILYWFIDLKNYFNHLTKKTLTSARAF